MTELYKEYSQALFMLAVEENLQKKFLEELKEIKEIFLNSPDFMSLLSSPAIPLSERKKVIDNALKDNYQEHIVSFIKLLCDKKHILSFDLCVDEYEALLENFESTSVAKVKSALELSSAQMEELTVKLKKLSGRNVVLECETDKTLLGGLIIEIDGKEIDASLKSRLKEVKEVIKR
ncbi:MAG: ATP synthase F1 subunit delta [Ruminococcaceae bacterium]|nr:ATP synthase F1 subunit delta [Oscillospiraceae bacterium]